MACHFDSRPSILSPCSTKWLSLVRWSMLLLVATNYAALNFKTGSGGPASYMAYLPLCAPDGERRYGQMGQSSRPPTTEAATTKMMTTRRTMEHPWIGGFQDQARLDLFVLLLGAFWASGACSSCAGEPWAATVFPWPIPDPGIFSVPLILGAAPNVHRDSASRRTLSPLINGSTCVTSATPQRRRSRSTKMMTVVHGGTLLHQPRGRSGNQRLPR
jgi:hypothetical protein